MTGSLDANPPTKRKPMTDTLYDIPVKTIDGAETTLAPFRSKVLLIVNVASQCGLTPQYAGLEALYEAKRDRGFAVLGFPANNFAGQEPGTNDEIKTFCETSYGVQFPMFAKISVKGEDQHPLYQHLLGHAPAPVFKPESKRAARYEEAGRPASADWEVAWNFEKFLVDGTGEVIGRFDPDVVPESSEIEQAVEAAFDRG
jgi:glutathione peroxidase